METQAEYAEIDFASDPIPNLHEILKDLRGRHRIAPVTYHGQVAYLITGYDDLYAAFSDEETFPSAAAYVRHSGPVMGKTIQCMGGEEHRRNRALVSKAFRPRLMAEYVESFLTEEAHLIVDRFSERGEADLVKELTEIYPFTIITRLLDLPAQEYETFKRWGDGLVSFPWDPEGALEASKEFTDYLRPLVAERRAHPGEDLLSSLATAEIDGERLSDEEIFSFARLLFPAGADTTYRGIGSLLFAVFSHPEAEAKLRSAELPPMRAVEEALRWEPPTSILPRFAPKTVRFADFEIPGDSEVLFGIVSAGRDERVYENPDRFDPTRDNRKLLSFGQGQHFCLGSHLARREMEVVLGVVLERLPGLRLTEPDASRVEGTVLRGPTSLPVRFEPGARRAGATAS